MRPSKRPLYLLYSPLFTQCAPPHFPFSYPIPRYLPNASLQSFRLAIPIPAIYPMRPSKRPVIYFIPRHFPTANHQMSRLAIPFPAIYPMRPSKHPILIFNYPLFTQCTTPVIPFRYSIPRYLHNASLQTYRLAIPLPALNPMRTSKRPI